MKTAYLASWRRRLSLMFGVAAAKINGNEIIEKPWRGAGMAEQRAGGAISSMAYGVMAAISGHGSSSRGSWRQRSARRMAAKAA
jgi:hypothetical protein